MATIPFDKSSEQHRLFLVITHSLTEGSDKFHAFAVAANVTLFLHLRFLHSKDEQNETDHLKERRQFVHLRGSSDPAMARKGGIIHNCVR